jgi:hypothetical protein
VAFDAATGEKRWEAPGVWPHGVSGDTAIDQEPASSDLPTSPRQLVDLSGAEVSSSVPGQPLARRTATASSSAAASLRRAWSATPSLDERYGVYALG